MATALAIPNDLRLKKYVFRSVFFHGLLIAAVFWAWLWGPIGLVLSTPLTVCLAVLGKHVPQLGLLHIFLGADKFHQFRGVAAGHALQFAH